jgi:hypothetical protein
MNIDEEILSMAKNYFRHPQVISSANGDRIKNTFPDQWLQIMTLPHSEWRNHVLELWKPFTSYLPKFYKTMEQFLVDVLIISEENSYKILYLFEFEGDKYLYLGGNPNEVVELSPELESCFEKLPESFKRFYSILHNGFVFLPAYSLGPLPKERMFLLSEEDWEWMEDENFDAPFELSQTIAIFSNGGGGYICLNPMWRNNGTDYSNCIVWWVDEPPDTDKFWPTLDTWMQLGLEE